MVIQETKDGSNEELKNESEIEEIEEQEQQEVKELEDTLIRLQADFENYRKRTLKDNTIMKEQGAKEFFSNILDVLDDLEQGSKSNDQIKLIYEKLLTRVSKLGFINFGAQEEKLDPEKHEVLGKVEGKENTIIQVVQKGWKYKDKIIRPARVIVGGITPS